MLRVQAEIAVGCIGVARRDVQTFVEGSVLLLRAAKRQYQQQGGEEQQANNLFPHNLANGCQASNLRAGPIEALLKPYLRLSILICLPGLNTFQGLRFSIGPKSITR